MAKSTTSRIIGWAFRLLVGAMICSILGVLLWRILSSGDPASMKAIQPNETLYSAYQAYLADTSPDKGDFEILHQQHDTIIRQGDAKGYFSVTQSHFIPAAEQLQITFRYNNSTLKRVAEDKGLPEPLKRGTDWFDVTVIVAYDLTPDNPDDNDINHPDSVRFVRYQPTDCVKDTKNLYNYERLTFDGILITDRVLAVYVDIYFNEDVDADYSKDPMGTLLIYSHGNDENRKMLSDTLSQKEIDALLDFGKK